MQAIGVKEQRMRPCPSGATTAGGRGGQEVGLVPWAVKVLRIAIIRKQNKLLDFDLWEEKIQ